MKEVIRKIVLVICIIVFLVSGGMLAKYFYDGYVVQKEFKALKTDYSLEDLQKQNSDIFGWLYVKDTKINYPVMFTPESPEYYLRRNFKKEHSMAGTPFVDGYTDMENSYNMIVYGHHMKDGTMFNNLLNYDEEDYYKEHQTVELETLSYGNHKYKVFAFGKTDATQEGFNVYDYVNIKTKSQYNSYVQGLKTMTPYDTGITPEFGQKIITLSTCSYHSDEGRYVVAAVEIDE